jgi:lipopolysaccharide export system protein LptA
MRRTRWLFLAVILGILVSVGATYLKRKASFYSNAPTPPKPLEAGTDARAQYWRHCESTDTQKRFCVQAASFREIKAPAVMELEDVQLQLFHKGGTEFDLVHSAKAQFDMTAKTLFSDGAVDINMGVPIDGPPHGHVVKIHSSGVSFQSDTGKATTDRKTEFEFDQGGGSAVGAEYDPQTRELHLRTQVSLDWRGKTPESVPMHIESGEAFYKERESKVFLLPWSKLTRDTLHMEAAGAVITLDDGEVRLAEVQAGHGVKDDPDRKVEFGADTLLIDFAEGMQVSKILGDHNGRLVSTAPTMRTTVTSNRLEMQFETTPKDSTLSNVVATGSSVAEAVPLPKPGSDLPETRVLRSDTIHLKMRSGGKEIENVETAGPGTLDFLPNRPAQPKRWLKGDHIWITYGAENRIQSFRSINVSTRTDKPPQPDKPVLPTAITQSKEIVATFDPKTSELAHLDQKTDFRYQEGDRQARSDRATLEQEKDLMTLDGSARVWDATGSASADHILMNQKSGDFTAEGHVASTHQPDKQGNSSAMLSTDEVMQARAQRMVSTENNQKIHYEGNAVAWQGANRVSADKLDIDRDAQILEAHGNVVSQFVDKNKDKDKAKLENGVAPPKKTVATAPIFTTVRAPDLVYTEESRIADYSGGVVLKRPDMTVTGKKIRAFLKDADEDSSLDKAFGDGEVKIVSTAQKRVRTGTSEHAEYYAGEEKVILVGADPLLVDSIKGQTRAPKQLTWFANDDRLIVDGVDVTNPAKSIIHKKKK